MRRFLTLLVAFVVFGVSSALAQTKQVSGRVVGSDDNLPIPGVNVLVKGAPTVGTITDGNGNFTIKNVPANGKILIFRFVGYQTLELPISGAVVNASLKAESTQIEEVMVVAYGTAKKGSFSGSAIEVKGAKLERKKTSELTQALAGEVAGVQVVTSSGQPGMSSKIRIRGIGSLNASQEPLIVVDGIPFGGDLSSIDPRDIASSTILKDASAAALYGSRASNGVLLIQTKKGTAGKSKITANVDMGLNMQILPYYKTVKDPAQYYQYSWEALKNGYIYGKVPATDAVARQKATDNLIAQLGGYNLYDINGDGKINTADKAIIGTDGLLVANAKRLFEDNWRDELIKTGYKKTVGINMSGGHERTTYYTSLNYLQDEGYVAKSDFKRLSTTTNLDHKVNNWLKFSEKLTYSYFKMNNSVSETTTAGNNAFYFANSMPPIYPVYVYDESGNPVYDLDGGRVYDYADNNPLLLGKKRKFAQAVNPARSYDLDEQYTDRHEIGGNMGTEVNILSNLKFSSNFGFNYSFNSDVRQQNGLYGDQKGVGSVSRDINTYMTWTWNQLINWNKTFDRHSISALLGHESYKYSNERMYGYKTKTLKEHTPFFGNAIVMGSLTGNKYERSMESYFGEINYDFSSKYFFKASLRSDCSSRFPNNKWGTFWSLAGSWKLTEEEFAKQLTFLNNLKYKVSYGVQGNESLTSSYPSYDYSDVANVNDQIGLVFANKGNQNLTWESNYNFNTGLEIGLWNRVNASLDFYIRDTKNMLYQRGMAPSLGYSSMYVNDLNMRNTGFEFDINVIAFKNKDTEVSFAVNGHAYKNEITKMPINPSTDKENLFIRNGTFGYEQGRSVYDRYIQKYAGVEATTGSPTWWMASGVNAAGTRIDLVDLNSDVEQSYTDIQWVTTKDYTKATRTFVGSSAIPDLNGGFSITASHKGFELDVRFIYSIGGKAYDDVYASLMNSGAASGTQVYHQDIANRWQKPGDITSVPKLSPEIDKNVTSTQDRWLTDASYLSLSNVRLGYTFSDRICKSLKLNNLSIYTSGTNLYSLTKRTGFYPQTSETGTSSVYRYMPLSAFSFGVNLSF